MNLVEVEGSQKKMSFQILSSIGPRRTPIFQGLLRKDRNIFVNDTHFSKYTIANISCGLPYQSMFSLRTDFVVIVVIDSGVINTSWADLKN